MVAAFIFGGEKGVSGSLTRLVHVSYIHVKCHNLGHKEQLVGCVRLSHKLPARRFPVTLTN